MDELPTFMAHPIGTDRAGLRADPKIFRLPGPAAPPSPGVTHAVACIVGAMASLFETVQEFFVTKGWVTEQTNDGILHMRYGGKNASWDCYVTVREEWGQATFLSLMPDKVPESKLPEVIEYIARANFGLVIGNLDLDIGHRQVRFRTNLDLGPNGHEDVPFATLFERAVMANVRSMDRYWVGVVDVLGGATPADALAKILAVPKS